MCTLILLYNVLDGYPVILAENRDAHIKSVEIPPALVSKSPEIYAALDKRSQGTWFGMNENGVAVGLTNLYSNTGEKKPTSSRGKLCLDALKKPTAVDVSEYLQDAYNFEKYAKLNLLSVDRNDAILTMCDREINVLELGDGIHVLTNYNLKNIPTVQEDIDIMADSKHRRDRALELMAGYDIASMKNIDDVLGSLEMILCDHEKSNIPHASESQQHYAICCHGNEKDYPWKTASSSIIALSEEGPKKSRYVYCAGNPCLPGNKFADYSFILKRSR